MVDCVFIVTMRHENKSLMVGTLVYFSLNGATFVTNAFGG